VTTVLYALIIINLPFNPVASTIFLFAIISYWSRLPGVGIPSPFFILYLADLVDLFSLLIAVNLGGIYGAIFSLFGNIGSRMAGITPYWSGVMKDGIIQFFICLIIPFIYSATGGNIVMTMMIYTIIRRMGFIVLWLIYPDLSLGEFCVIWVGVTFASLTINAFYAKYFGGFFDGLLQSGVSFNWPMFIFVTIIVIAGKTYFFGTSKSKFMDQKYLLKHLLHKVIPQEKGNKINAVNDIEIIAEVKSVI